MKKNKNKGLFRLKAIIPFTILAGGIIAFCILFLDPILKNTVSDILTKKNNGKVDLLDLKTTFRNTGLSLQGLQWTDSEKPTYNLFEFDKAIFSINSQALLSKKMHINMIQVTGLFFKTERAKSGAIGKMNDEGSTRLEPDEALPTTTSAPETESKNKTDYLKKVKKMELPIQKDAKKFNNKMDERSIYWKSKIQKSGDISDVQSTLTAINSFDPKIYKDIKQIKKAQSDLTTLKKSAAVLKSKKQELGTLQSEFLADKKSLQNDYSKLIALKNQGLKGLLSESLIGSPDSLIRDILGPDMADTVLKVQSYYERFKDYLPSGDRSSDQPSEGNQDFLKGTTVHFKKNDARPALLIDQILLSGEILDQLPLTGQINKISSDLKNHPITFKFSGGSKKNNKGWLTTSGRISQTVIHNKKKFANKIIFSAGQINLAGSQLMASSKLISGIKKGSLSLKGSIIEANDILTITVSLLATGVSLSTKKPKSKINKIIAESLKKLPTLKIKILLKIKNKKVVTKITSNLDGIIKKALQQSMSRELNKKKAQIKAIYDNRVAEVMDPLNGKVNSFGNKKNALTENINSIKNGETLLSEKEAELKKRLKELNPVQQKTQEATKKATDVIKKSAGKKLKKLKF